MALYPQPVQSMAWQLLREGSYVFQATCDLTSYSVVPFLANGPIINSVVAGSGQVSAHEMGIDNTGNSKAVSVMVGKLYIQNVPPYTQTTIELGDTAPMVQVTGGGVCLVTFSTTTVPGTEAATNPYAAALGAIGVFLPAGSVMLYAGPVGNIPTGWQLCDGSALSRANNPNLYGAIGTLYGAGDGSSTFNVPDLRGRFARGFDNGAGVDTGRQLGSSQPYRLPRHQHALPFYQYGTTFYAITTSGGVSLFGQKQVSANGYYYGSGTLLQGSQPIAYSDDGMNFTVTQGDASGNGDLAPANVAMNYIIKL